MNRTVLAWSAILIGMVVLGALLAGFRYAAFLDEPLAVPEGGVVVVVSPGDSVRSVILDLDGQGVTSDGWQWRVLGRRHPVTIQTGEYLLTPGLRPESLLDRMAAGDVIRYPFTIVEGWTYRQLLDALLSSAVLVTDPVNLDPEAVMANLGSEPGNPEGWFLPETYAVVRGDTGLQLLQRAHQAMGEALDEAWQARDLGLPLQTPYELLVLASIVEKESAVESERPDVAGVFVRRLQQRWRLETDPTVIYGLGDAYDGDIRSKDLRTDTPYNTYTRHGLPPTPIAMPGRSALQASASPAAGSAMFFVADGQGGHVFSDTLEQHNRAVQALIRRGRE